MPQIFFNEVSVRPNTHVNIGGSNINNSPNMFHQFIQLLYSLFTNLFKIFPIIFNLLRTLSVVLSFQNIFSYFLPWIIFVVCILFLFKRYIYRSKNVIEKSDEEDATLIKELYKNYEKLDSKWQNKF